jgi:hypothetical protein
MDKGRRNRRIPHIPQTQIAPFFSI